jgi:hypothetical protein
VLIDTLRHDPYPLPGHSTLGIQEYKDDRLPNAYTVPFATGGLLLYQVLRAPVPTIRFVDVVVTL